MLRPTDLGSECLSSVVPLSKIPGLWGHEEEMITRTTAMFIDALRGRDFIAWGEVRLEDVFPEYEFVEPRVWWNVFLRFECYPAMFEQVVAILPAYPSKGCLLYTSPSPRDRG